MMDWISEDFFLLLFGLFEPLVSNYKAHDHQLPLEDIKMKALGAWRLHGRFWGLTRRINGCEGEGRASISGFTLTKGRGGMDAATDNRMKMIVLLSATYTDDDDDNESSVARQTWCMEHNKGLEEGVSIELKWTRPNDIEAMLGKGGSLESFRVRVLERQDSRTSLFQEEENDAGQDSKDKLQLHWLSRQFFGRHESQVNLFEKMEG
ncbi:hypothetical protein Tco_1329960 [Tanacetum coccineum]